MVKRATDRRLLPWIAVPLLAFGLAIGPACAQSGTPAPGAPAPGEAAPSAGTAAKPTAAPATPSTATPPSATPPTPAPAPAPPASPSPSAAPAPGTAPPATPEGVPLAPKGKPETNEIEPNASPTTPEKTTTENVDVPSRPIVVFSGQSSYDDAFKAIKGSLETARKAMDKAGLAPTGHPITIFSAPDDKGFKYQSGFPIAQKPDKTDLGGGVSVAASPAGKAIKFQHRGPYDDIDATYDVITAFLDAKGLQVDSPYIEEYLTDLTTADDPNLQVDIYVFVK